ncbi:MAG TPA: hypothetical protein VK665_02490 [Candidatus Elarobacter sp.]|nr:hypothetical protein [Candidatus Elarobacter sp.]
MTMPGIRRTAVVAAAFLLLCATWATAQSQREHVLPAGTAVVFITDAPLEPGRHEGDVVAVHLRDNLALDGTVLAAAGTRAYLVVGSVEGPNGTRRPAVSLERFAISAGPLPVKAVAPIVAPVPAGAQIDARTEAEIDHIGDRYSVRVPFPFRLSNDAPSSAYTPTPARTASPTMLLQRPPRGSSPAPSPSAATPVPSPAASKAPGTP